MAEFLGLDIPAYAILSHTWGADREEVTFKDVLEGTGRKKVGYRKIRFCAEQAAKDGLKYFWIDTCCIDKRSSAELTEAINSMFRWYQGAGKCYVYLSDVSAGAFVGRYHPSLPNDLESQFKKSRWFTRGWTLQELIAPQSVEFFSVDGISLGNKMVRERIIHETTGISFQALRGDSLSTFAIHDRMSWAAKRHTKREEDAAYCLLGIFDVHMSLIYGEGRKNAMSRLEAKIRKSMEENTPPSSMADLAVKGSERSDALKNQQVQLLMKSLSFDQLDARQFNIKEAHARTCRWILQSQHYLKWRKPENLDQCHGFLWIKGKAGSGKSTLMKFLLSESRTTTTNTTIIAFFFNARGARLERSTTGTYQSLLLQLLERFPKLRYVFDHLYLSTETINERFRWTDQTLKMLLEKVIINIIWSPVICFIDALDECEEEAIRDMVAFFEDVSAKSRLSNVQFHVCFSSRHYPHISIRRGIELVLEQQDGHEQDISNYITDKLRIGYSRTATEIRTIIQEKASGVFVWVVLVVALLNKEYDRGRIHTLWTRLQEIPTDIYLLFVDMLKRDSSDRDELLLCIQWILFAQRPLSPEELYLGILCGTSGIGGGPSEYNPHDVPRDAIERFILNASKGLAELVRSGVPTVQFIHESVKDLLLRGSEIGQIWPGLERNWEGQSHERLAKLCLQSLENDHSTLLSLHPLTARAKFKLNRSRFPFLGYMVPAVLYHANAAAGCGISQKSFLQTFPTKNWFGLNFILEGNERFKSATSIIVILATLGLSELLRYHPSITQYSELGDTHWKPGFTSFMGPERIDYRSVVVTDVAKDISLKPRTKLQSVTYPRGYTILSYHREDDNRVMFCWLLGQASSTAMRCRKEEDGGRMLLWAVNHGHEEVIKQLLVLDQTGLNWKDEQGRTPLARAVEMGHKSIIRQLLSSEAVDVNSHHRKGRTLLSCAAEEGKHLIVKQLLATGKADLESKDLWAGRTPLALAAYEGHTEVVRLLLAIDKINYHAKDRFGETPIVLAVYNGHEEVVKLLHASGRADIASRNRHGLTLLELSILRRNPKMVKTLRDILSPQE